MAADEGGTMRVMISRVLLVSAVFCLAGAASGTTYVVDQSGGGDFETVQAAVDSAANRDTLLIMAGEYQESITCSGKCLTYLGQGAGVTVIAASEAAPALTIQNMPWSIGESVVAGLTLLDNGGSVPAVVWNQARASFVDCQVPGELRGGSSSESYALTTLTRCTVGEARVWGGDYGGSTITDSEIGVARFTGRLFYDWGTSWCEGHSLETSHSVIGDLTLACHSHLVSNSDEIGVLTEQNGSTCQATGTSFGTISLGLGDFGLFDCLVAGSVEVNGNAGVSDYCVWDVDIERTVVEGDLDLHYDAYNDQVIFTMQLVHNTIAGGLTTEFSFSGTGYTDRYDVLSNIVVGHTALDGATAWMFDTDILNNDFAGGFTPSGVAGTIQHNIDVAPLFCGASSGDYELQECSPCVDAAHDGTDIGALGTGCACLTAVEEMHWGSIKALFRQPSN
jgi:hypothetical protein